MNVGTINKFITESLNLCIYTEADFYTKGNDFDGMTYELIYKPAEGHISASYSIPNFDELFKLGGEDMLKKVYQGIEYRVNNMQGEYNITLTKVLKNVLTNIKDKDQIKKITKEKEEVIPVLCNLFSQFKRYLYGIPFSRAMNSCLAGKQESLTFSNFRKEKVWIIGLADKVLFFYGFKFDDKTDNALSYAIIQELMEAKRHVQNAPEFLSIHAKNPSEILTKNHPDSKKFIEDPKYQVVQIALFKNQFEKNIEKCSEMLQGFREYIQYHVYATKTYLHGRVRRKVQGSLKDIDNAKFESEKKKVYRTLKGKGKEVKFEAEKEKVKDIIQRT